MCQRKKGPVMLSGCIIIIITFIKTSKDGEEKVVVTIKKNIQNERSSKYERTCSSEYGLMKLQCDSKNRRESTVPVE